MVDAAVAVAFQDLCDRDLVAIESLPLLLLGRLMGRVLDELLQGFQAVPVVDVADQPGSRVFR